MFVNYDHSNINLDGNVYSGPHKTELSQKVLSCPYAWSPQIAEDPNSWITEVPIIISDSADSEIFG